MPAWIQLYLGVAKPTGSREHFGVRALRHEHRVLLLAPGPLAKVGARATNGSKRAPLGPATTLLQQALVVRPKSTTIITRRGKCMFINHVDPAPKALPLSSRGGMI